MGTMEQLSQRINSKITRETGEDGQVSLSEESRKHSGLRFRYGWTLNYGLNYQSLGNRSPRGGYYCGSPERARSDATSQMNKYKSGADPSFLRLLRSKVSNTLSSFRTHNMVLGNDGDLYYGSETCTSCSGRGENSCTSCNYSSGWTTCNSCYGRGYYHDTQYINGRNETVRRTCSVCYGNGKTRCYTCSGSGKVQCSSCNGSGEHYYGYYITVTADRGTNFVIKDDTPHSWTLDFLKAKGLESSHYFTEIEIKELEAGHNGYSVAYEMHSVLPTLQYKATIPAGSTEMRFIGENDDIYDAGCVMDASFWERAINLGAGSVQRDKNILALSGVKKLLKKHESDNYADLMSDNWISKDIYKAFTEKYETFVGSLSKQNKKGLWKTIILGYLLTLLTLTVPVFLIGVFSPEAAVEFNWYLHDYFRNVSELRPWALQNTLPSMLEEMIDGYYRKWDSLAVAALAAYGFTKLVQFIHRKKHSKKETFFSFLVWFWLLPYFFSWIAMMINLTVNNFGDTPSKDVEWYIYCIALVYNSLPEIFLFSAAIAFVVLNWRYWKKKSNRIQQYDSEILNSRFKLKAKS
ncbi:DnaJ-like cysteine-rich domain-containing protein [Parendozoicomonas haliclonae]|uniref:CR-type domain-containing protein n=1 Tax=Parendozoicomonas haliclonae TaxID=1960125 RepID=A0A1X7AFB0_9GAMM|nr:hypothetical protein [Parendozoicomonas haliclonae]SMA35703.1 hypothetical protein EHSB41UT_00557 [Parendozoicomonas haliclonae]